MTPEKTIVRESWGSKFSRLASRATGFAVNDQIGHWVTSSMIQAENLNVADNMIDPAVPATELFTHLNHLSELHSGWSSMGVDAAQILIGGVLALDSIAVDKKKPLTVGGTVAEAVTTMAAMTTPVLLPEIVNTIQNAIELEHVITTFGELAILAIGAHKIGAAVTRIIKSYKQSKLDHLANKQRLANTPNPEGLEVMTEDLKKTLITMHHQAHTDNKNLKNKLKVKEGKQIRENKEYNTLYPTPPTEPPQVKKGELIEKLKAAGAYPEEIDASARKSPIADTENMPTFLRSRKQ